MIFHCSIIGLLVLDQTKPSYYQYKALLQRIRSLIDEFEAIRKNETIGICDICKRYNSTGRCKRCEIIASKYGVKAIKEEIRQERYKTWIHKVKHFLYTILEKEICKRGLYYLDTQKTDELINLFQQLMTPMNIVYQIKSDFVSFDSLQSIIESKDIIEDILFKMRVGKKFVSANIKPPGVPCPSTCKYFSDSRIEYFPQEIIDKIGLRRVTKTDTIEYINGELNNINKVGPSNVTKTNTIEYTNGELNNINKVGPSNVTKTNTIEYTNGELNNISKVVSGNVKKTRTNEYSNSELNNIPLTPGKERTKRSDKFDKNTTKNIQENDDHASKQQKTDQRHSNNLLTKTNKITSNTEKRQPFDSNNTQSTENKASKVTKPEVTDFKTKMAGINQKSINSKIRNETNLVDDKSKIIIDSDEKKSKETSKKHNIKELNDNDVKSAKKEQLDDKRQKKEQLDDKRQKKEQLDDKKQKKDQLDDKKQSKNLGSSNQNNLSNGVKLKSRSHIQSQMSDKELKSTDKNKNIQTKQKENSVQKEGIKQKTTNPEDDMMAKLINSLKKNSEPKKVPQKQEKVQNMPNIPELPIIQRKHSNKELVKQTSESESIIECKLFSTEPAEMIIGTELTPINYCVNPNTGSVSPMLFKVEAEFNNGVNSQNTSTLSELESDKINKQQKKSDLSNKQGSKGVVKYMLSNKEFIVKGWTMLPTAKIMRRMNIYKMLPAHPKYNWFLRNKHRYLMFYECGEKLAEIHEDGSGKWFYKNSNVALDHYISEEASCGRRYIVYSSGNKDELGHLKPVTVLACFDYLGNGVVYDHFGNERLKYNQSEGMVIDEKIGAPGRWKWHTLNEPPVLQPVFIDTYIKVDNAKEDPLKSRKEEDLLDARAMTKKEPNEDMVAIELDNIMKEKADKLLQKFKPFHIKMKALKINSYFSLKILDQSNIYLIFRDGSTVMKVNLGMQLISDEIIDTDTADVIQVSTPYDRFPPKSQSVANIKNILEQSRKLENASKKFESDE